MNKSSIEWTDVTWNPVSGCSKVSQGCKNCYAERVFPRVYSKDQVFVRHPETGDRRSRGRDFTDVLTHPLRLDTPRRMRQPRRIFVNSMSDLFHEAVPDTFIDNVFITMALAQQHQFQILTKRPERMRKFMDEDFAKRYARIADAYLHENDVENRLDVIRDLDGPLPNVWLGVSVEDQASADERIPLLLKTPAAVRFVSAEPLLGMVDLTSIEVPDYKWVDALKGIQCGDSVTATAKINLVIAGYESGSGARPGHPEWAAQLRDQCAAVGTKFFFKQWGEWAPRSALSIDVFNDATTEVYVKLDGTVYDVHDESDPHQFDASDVMMYRVGKKLTGRTLDGREHNDLPEAVCTAA